MKQLLCTIAALSAAVLLPREAEAQVMTYPGSSVGISPFSPAYTYLTSPHITGRSSSSRYDYHYGRSRSGYRSYYDSHDRYDYRRSGKIGRAYNYYHDRDYNYRGSDHRDRYYRDSRSYDRYDDYGRYEGRTSRDRHYHGWRY